MYWLILFFVFIFLLTISQLMLNMLAMRHVHINRWAWALASFLIVILPKIILPQMNVLLSWGTYILCGIFAINFMIEQHRWFVTSKL
ncbi:diacylglycerol kinase [Enterococcus lactis]|uniref:diacylglycerol kinase n=1 Tax=Enterococcus lactis TaxID=357441 RepID=UPI00237B61FA|nr:diacylglycerol kinase [Enterococcus lactis]